MQIGIAGLGFMGTMHLEAYAKIPGVRVAAICTRSERALSGDLSEIGGNLQREKTAFDFSSATRYEKWSEMIADSELDAIDICLPTDLHAAVSAAASEAGKHVLCEKPMAPDYDECVGMILAAKDNRRRLMIGQVLRFWPEYLYLQQELQSGDRGPVLAASFQRSCGLPSWSSWLPDEKRSGGAVLDLLIHDIDQISLLFGMPERVSAKSLGPVDTMAAKLFYPNGFEVSLEGGWRSPEAPLSMTFEVQWEGLSLALTSEGLLLADRDREPKKVHLPAGDGYQAEIAYFVDCCRKGEAPEKCLPQDSAKAVKLAQLLKEARAKEGKEIACWV